MGADGQLLFSVGIFEGPSMSAGCSSCERLLKYPEPIWYAGTRYAWDIWWICGECLAGIPEAERHPAKALMEFEITFGPVDAEANGRGWYQWTSAKQLQPQFWVRNDVLAKHVPAGEDFVSMFYPFNDLPRYLPWLACGVRAGTIPSSGDRNKLLRDLTLLGPVLERYLHGPCEPRRKSVLPYGLELTEEHNALAEELLAEILRRY